MKKGKMKGLFLGGILLFGMMFCQNVQAEGPITEYNINTGSVNLSADGTYRIAGTGTETSNSITVNSGVNATIILENVNISSGCAFRIEDNSHGNVTVQLVGTNRLHSTDAPGIQKNADLADAQTGKLVIEDYPGDSGTGSLTCSTGNGDAAGIGSSNQKDTRNIEIKSGNISASANLYGAGIGGGGGGGSASHIYISGGTITATSGLYVGATIGGGSDYFEARGTGKNIYITGGDLTLTNRSGIGAGIGGGYGEGTDIYITGGTIKVQNPDKTIIGGGDETDGLKSSNIVVTVPVYQSDGTTTVDASASNFTSAENSLVLSDSTYILKGEMTSDQLATAGLLTIPSGKTLQIKENAKLTIQPGVQFVNNGAIENAGLFLNLGTYTNNGNVTGSGLSVKNISQPTGDVEVAFNTNAKLMWNIDIEPVASREQSSAKIVVLLDGDEIISKEVSTSESTIAFDETYKLTQDCIDDTPMTLKLQLQYNDNLVSERTLHVTYGRAVVSGLSLNGINAVGKKLVVQGLDAVENPGTIGIQWYRKAPDGTVQAIAEAVDSTYVLTKEDTDHYIYPVITFEKNYETVDMSDVAVLVKKQVTVNITDADVAAETGDNTQILLYVFSVVLAIGIMGTYKRKVK